MENLDQSWRKSSYSGDGGASCVEVGQARGTVLVRDTKQHGHGQVHRFTPAAWQTFICDLKAVKAA
jgi:hypothetical protein